MNNRPIESPNLREAMAEVAKVFRRRGLAGACMMVDPGEAAFIYPLSAPWSAICEEPAGLRIRAVAADGGREARDKKLGGAAHTAVSLLRFAETLAVHMRGLMATMWDAGIEITDTDQPEPPPRKPLGEKKVPREMIDRVTEALIADGLVIEAGFAGLRLMAIPKDAPQIQVDEMRMAFFAGAQHILSSVMSALDEGAEPTEADMKRMDNVNAELERFTTAFMAEHAAPRPRS